MRKIVVAVSLAVLACEAQADYKLSASRQAALTAIKKAAPNIIRDAAWESEKRLLVGVNDDGSRRDGLAQSICQDLYESGLRGAGIMVSVVDYAKLMGSSRKYVRLGKHRCD